VIPFLKRPYPIRLDLKSGIKDSFYVGVFVLIFLLIFQPFGLSTTETPIKIYLICGYAIVCFLVLFTNSLLPILLKKLFNEEKWCVYKHILWRLWIIFSIGLGNYLFACIFDSIIDFFQLGVKTFLLFLLITLIIAIIPMTVYTLITHNQLLKKNIKTAETITEQISASRYVEYDSDDQNKKQILVLLSENNKESCTFPASYLLYISSEDNYVRIVFCKSEKIEKKLIRNSLKNIEKQIKDFPLIFRSHRAYIVNINKIINSSGNAQGLKLSIRHTDFKVPVSRGYYKKFNEILSSYHK